MEEAKTRVAVPIAEVAVVAYRGVFGHLNLLFDLAWLPLLIMLAAALLPGYLHIYLGWGGVLDWQIAGLNLRADNLVEAFVALLCLNAFAVRWHQAVLFSGERQIPEGVSFLGAWGRFLLYTLLLYLASGGLLAMIMIADANGALTYLAPIGALLAVFMWIVIVRCSLLFPAAAFGKPLGPVAAWRAMRGNSWRLLGCTIVACAPLMIIVPLFLSAVSAGLHLEPLPTRVPLGFFILRGVVVVCTDVIIVALGASVLSAFYRRIMLRGLGVF